MYRFLSPYIYSILVPTDAAYNKSPYSKSASLFSLISIQILSLH